MSILPVNEKNFKEVATLLALNNLPTEDITEATELFALYQGEELIGTIGLDRVGTTALLRSLCVNAQCRGTGSGDLLVNYIEKQARKEKITAIYLLTTTAEAFFSKRGYQIIDRAMAPKEIQQTAQFTSICKSAPLMKKSLV